MYMGSRRSRTASCAFSVVPDGGFLAEIQFPGLASWLILGRPCGTGFWLRSSSQDCVLGYSRSSLRTGFWVGIQFPGLASGTKVLGRPARQCRVGLVNQARLEGTVHTPQQTASYDFTRNRVLPSKPWVSRTQ
jgi:hypothetical protein